MLLRGTECKYFFHSWPSAKALLKKLQFGKNQQPFCLSGRWTISLSWRENVHRGSLILSAMGSPQERVFFYLRAPGAWCLPTDNRGHSVGRCHIGIFGGERRRLWLPAGEEHWQTHIYTHKRKDTRAQGASDTFLHVDVKVLHAVKSRNICCSLKNFFNQLTFFCVALNHIHRCLRALTQIK